MITIANPLTTSELRDCAEDTYSQLVTGADWDGTIRDLERRHPGLTTSDLLAGAHHVHRLMEDCPYVADWAIALAAQHMAPLAPQVWRGAAAVHIAIADQDLADDLAAAIHDAVDQVLAKHRHEPAS